MLEFLVGLMIISFWVSLIAISVILFLMRLIILLRDKPSIRKCLYVLLTPCSIGYYCTYQDKSTFKTLYEIMVVIQFFLMLLGTVMVFYNHFL